MRHRALRFTRQGLDSIAESLQKGLGSFWLVRVVLRTDDSNAFDPPASYVEARLLGVCLHVCEDGEAYLHGVYPRQEDDVLPEGIPVMAPFKVSEDLATWVAVSKDLATWMMPDSVQVAGVADHVISMLGTLNGRQTAV